MACSALVIDDDASFRRIVEIRLRAWDKAVEISTAESLAQARSALDLPGKRFTLVVLDQNLPDGFGWELLSHPGLLDAAVLAVSADNSPDLPGLTVKAGAAHFLAKRQVTEPLFIPLVEALIERKRLEQEVMRSKIRESRMETIKTLLATLRHEINNPLGAVLGGTYLLRSAGQLSQEQTEALRLIEASGHRIKYVITQLCEAAELEEVTKAKEQLFQIPGDAPWGGSQSDEKKK